MHQRNECEQNSKRSMIRLILLLVVISVVTSTTAAAFTLAYSRTNTHTSNLIPAEVAFTVEKTGTTTYTVTNNSNIPTYFRFVIDTGWRGYDSLGSEIGFANVYHWTQPSITSISYSGSDTSAAQDASNYVLNADGHYYYKQKVAPGEKIVVAVTTESVNNHPSGYDELNIVFMAEMIQADPVRVVNEKWSYTYS